MQRREFVIVGQSTAETDDRNVWEGVWFNVDRINYLVWSVWSGLSRRDKVKSERRRSAPVPLGEKATDQRERRGGRKKREREENRPEAAAADDVPFSLLFSFCQLTV